MRLCAFKEYGAVAAGVVNGGRVVSLDDLNDALGTDFGPDVDELLHRQQADALRQALTSARLPTSGWKPENLSFAPPVSRPGKVWGVGLNFAAHAEHLGATRPSIPGAWMRPSSTLAGAERPIALPEGVGAVTAEAEIAVVLGRHARALASVKEAREAVFGFMPVLDLTAEDLVRQDARLLAQAKAYDGFCVAGPFVTSLDEWEPTAETVVTTTVDGATRSGRVGDMRHDPFELVRHFSHVFAWEPGDVLLTGTPGALPLRAGVTVRAEVSGMPPLEARVAGAP